MSIIVNIYYTGEYGNARRFAEEMEAKGIADRVRKEIGNLGHEYFVPMDDPETVLLIDKWKDQESLDFHHKSKMMKDTAKLSDRYELKMKVKSFTEYKEDI